MPEHQGPRLQFADQGNSVSQFSAFVASALGVKPAKGVHRHLIVDASVAGGRDMASQLRLPVHAMDLLTGDPCEWRDCASPVLLPLGAEPIAAARTRLVAEALEKWRYANCFLYIESMLPEAQMAQALKARTDALLSQDMPVVLRYFDSRVFAALTQALTPEQQSAFFSAGTIWAYPGRRGEVHRIEVAPQADAFEAPLRLDAAQEALLIEHAEADAMVGLLLNQNNPQLGHLLPPEQHARVSSALEAAKSLRIDQLRDQVAYCALDLELGAAFHEQPPWSDWMPKVNSGQMRFAEVVSRAAATEPT